jgi:hypothetical protein
MNRFQQRRVARKHGILSPRKAWKAAKNADIPFYVMCAFLMQESAGGKNIYGHDVNADGSPKPFWGHGEVTRENYIAYLKERDLGIVYHTRFPTLGYRRQGVGPMQLTWHTLQNQADALGGCWDEYSNMLVGARVIKAHFDVAISRFKTPEQAWHYAALKYNGKESYADEMDDRFEFWKSVLE